MVADLSRSVEDANKQVAVAFKRLNSIDEHLERIEGQLYKVQVLERTHDKTTDRLETIETHMELQQEKQ